MSDSLVQVPVLLMGLVSTDAHPHVNDTHNNNSKTARGQFCPVFNKPAKYISIFEIHYSKDYQIEALAFKALPPTT